MRHHRLLQPIGGPLSDQQRFAHALRVDDDGHCRPVPKVVSVAIAAGGNRRGDDRPRHGRRKRTRRAAAKRSIRCRSSWRLRHRRANRWSTGARAAADDRMEGASFIHLGGSEARSSEDVEGAPARKIDGAPRRVPPGLTYVSGDRVLRERRFHAQPARCRSSNGSVVLGSGDAKEQGRGARARHHAGRLRSALGDRPGHAKPSDETSPPPSRRSVNTRPRRSCAGGAATKGFAHYRRAIDSIRNSAVHIPALHAAAPREGRRGDEGYAGGLAGRSHDRPQKVRTRRYLPRVVRTTRRR